VCHVHLVVDQIRAEYRWDLRTEKYAVGDFTEKHSVAKKTGFIQAFF